MNYYEILGIKQGASDEEIKNAYRELAMKYHPFKNKDNPDAEKKMKEVNVAYETLSDKDKRAAYDYELKNPGMKGFGGRGGNTGGFGGGFDTSIFDDILSSFGFGSSHGSTRTAVGADLNFTLNITFEEAVFGVTKEVKINRQTTCSSCNGTGAKDGTSYSTCAPCGGKGKQQVVQTTPFGRFSSVQTCSACKGTGKSIKETCQTCKGAGRERKPTILSVKVPAGIDDEQILTMRGEGDMASGGSGNVNIVIRIAPHATFKRKGVDLYLDMPITFIQAMLGCKLQIDNLDGSPLALDIKEGTQTGTQFRFKGKGIKHLRNENKGDVYVTVNVEVPTNLTQSQKEALRKIDSDINSNQYGKQKSFFEKMKAAFTKKK